MHVQRFSHRKLGEVLQSLDLLAPFLKSTMMDGLCSACTMLGTSEASPTACSEAATQAARDQSWVPGQGTRLSPEVPQCPPFVDVFTMPPAARPSLPRSTAPEGSEKLRAAREW